MAVRDFIVLLKPSTPPEWDEAHLHLAIDAAGVATHDAEGSQAVLATVADAAGASTVFVRVITFTGIAAFSVGVDAFATSLPVFFLDEQPAISRLPIIITEIVFK